MKKFAPISSTFPIQFVPDLFHVRMSDQSAQAIQNILRGAFLYLAVKIVLPHLLAMQTETIPGTQAELNRELGLSSSSSY